MRSLVKGQTAWSRLESRFPFEDPRLVFISRFPSLLAARRGGDTCINGGLRRDLPRVSRSLIRASFMAPETSRTSKLGALKVPPRETARLLADQITATVAVLTDAEGGADKRRKETQTEILSTPPSCPQREKRLTDLCECADGP